MKSQIESSAPSTRASIIQTRRSPHQIPRKKSASISQGVPSIFIPTNSEQTDSASTFKDNQNISHSLNTHRLKLSLRGIYESDPKEKLEKIFGKTQTFTPQINNEPKSKSKNLKNKRKYRRFDSMFAEKEAELIRSELNTIKSPKVWQQVVRNFKQSPNILLDLVPVE